MVVRTLSTNANRAETLDGATGSPLPADQNHRLQTARPQSVEPDPEQAVDRKQPGSTRPLATKNVQLMTEGEDL